MGLWLFKCFPADFAHAVYGATQNFIYVVTINYYKLSIVTMAAIKIDDGLLEKIKQLIRKGDNRFDFPTVKSFVDKAILKYLKDKNGKKEQEKSG